MFLFFFDNVAKVKKKKLKTVDYYNQSNRDCKRNPYGGNNPPPRPIYFVAELEGYKNDKQNTRYGVPSIDDFGLHNITS